MTDTDKRAFAQAFNVLAVATRLGPADPTMQRIYFEGLKDLELGPVADAAGALAKSAKFFPKVSEWRDAARIQTVATLKALGDGRETPWQDECGACSDTGWEERRCYPGTRNTCGRKKCEQERAEHFYAIVCTCRPNNRTYARHHTLGNQASYAE
jgi:hypothetical protein